MALANDSFQLTPDGSGVLLPTHLISGKEYVVWMNAGVAGHVYGSSPTYFAHFDYDNADATAHDIFDFWNGSSNLVRVAGIWCILRQDVAITYGSGGNVEKPARVDYFKTSAVGTGGTAFTYNGTSGTTCVPKDTTNAALPAGISGRATPTGGATVGSFLFFSTFRLNTTSPLTGLTQWQNLLPINERGEQQIWLNANEGIKARQPADLSAMIATGSAGYHHLVEFEVT